MNKAIILVGSNINPQKNIKKCLQYLADTVQITSFSHIWKTKAHGSKGPDFLNVAAEITTDLNIDELRIQVHREIENKLNRVRVIDKNAPRTIDIDTIFFNGQILDDELWIKGFMAIPIAELSPSLIDPKSGQYLSNIAEKLKSSTFIELFIPPDKFFPY